MVRHCLITVSYFEAGSGQDVSENLNWNWLLLCSKFCWTQTEDISTHAMT